MPHYFLTVAPPAILLGGAIKKRRDCASEPHAAREKKPLVFYRVDSQDVADRLLEWFRHANLDLPLPGHPDITISALEKRHNVFEGAYQPAFGVVDTAILEKAQKLAGQEAVELLERIRAVGDMDPGVWADAGLPHDRRAVLLMEYYCQAETWEPDVRKELATEAGNRPVYMWFTYGELMPLDSTADMNQKFFFYKVDRVDLAKHLHSMFQKSQGAALLFGYEYGSDLDAGDKVLAETSIAKYRNREVTGMDADFYATAAEWEGQLRKELGLPSCASTQPAPASPQKPPAVTETGKNIVERTEQYFLAAGGIVFYQVDSMEVAKQLLELFRRDRPEADKPFTILDGAALDVPQRVLRRQDMTLIERDEADDEFRAQMDKLGEPLDEDYLPEGFSPERRVNEGLMSLHYKGHEWEPLVRQELGIPERKASGEAGAAGEGDVEGQAETSGPTDELSGIEKTSLPKTCPTVPASVNGANDTAQVVTGDAKASAPSESMPDSRASELALIRARLHEAMPYPIAERDVTWTGDKLNKGPEVEILMTEESYREHERRIRENVSKTIKDYGKDDKWIGIMAAMFASCHFGLRKAQLLVLSRFVDYRQSFEGRCMLQEELVDLATLIDVQEKMMEFLSVPLCGLAGTTPCSFDKIVDTSATDVCVKWCRRVFKAEYGLLLKSFKDNPVHYGLTSESNEATVREVILTQWIKDAPLTTVPITATIPSEMEFEELEARMCMETKLFMRERRNRSATSEGNEQSPSPNVPPPASKEQKAATADNEPAAPPAPAAPSVPPPDDEVVKATRNMPSMKPANAPGTAPGPKYLPTETPLDWLVVEADNYAVGREDHFHEWTYKGFVMDGQSFDADCRASFAVLTQDASEWLLSCGHTNLAGVVADAYEQLSRDALTLDQILDVRAAAPFVDGVDDVDGEHHERVSKLVPRYKGYLAAFARRLWRVKEALNATMKSVVPGPLRDQGTASAFEKTRQEQPDAPKDTPEATLDLDSRACGVLAAHSDWSDTKIAKFLKCTRTSLYRLPRFRAARELQKEEKKRNLPSGRWNKNRNEPEGEERDEER